MNSYKNKKNKILIVVADYYQEVTKGLVQGATEYLDLKENKEIFFSDDIKVEYEIKKVPGAFEIPFCINLKKVLFCLLRRKCSIASKTCQNDFALLR